MTGTWDHPDEPARPWRGVVTAALRPTVLLDGYAITIPILPDRRCTVTQDTHDAPAKLDGVDYPRLGVQVDATTNDAIQAAAMNGMGMVLGRVRAGTLSLDQVRSGAATREFIDYMRTSVGGALAHHDVPDARLALMLQGKMETALKDADLMPATALAIGVTAQDLVTAPLAALAGRLDALHAEVAAQGQATALAA